MKNKGITLIALVVTIIVLIILAAVSINLLLSNNGIIKKARDAKLNYELASNEEYGMLANFDENLDKILADMLNVKYKIYVETRNSNINLHVEPQIKDGFNKKNMNELGPGNPELEEILTLTNDEQSKLMQELRNVYLNNKLTAEDFSKKGVTEQEAIDDSKEMFQDIDIEVDENLNTYEEIMIDGFEKLMARGYYKNGDKEIDVQTINMACYGAIIKHLDMVVNYQLIVDMDKITDNTKVYTLNQEVAYIIDGNNVGSGNNIPAGEYILKAQCKGINIENAIITID